MGGASQGHGLPFHPPHQERRPHDDRVPRARRFRDPAQVSAAAGGSSQHPSLSAAARQPQQAPCISLTYPCLGWLVHTHNTTTPSAQSPPSPPRAAAASKSQRGDWRRDKKRCPSSTGAQCMDKPWLQRPAWSTGIQTFFTAAPRVSLGDITGPTLHCGSENPALCHYCLARRLWWVVIDNFHLLILTEVGVCIVQVQWSTQRKSLLTSHHLPFRNKKSSSTLCVNSLLY